MLYGGGIGFLLELCLVIYCVLDVITTPDHAVRNLPKLLWLALVIVLPIIGGVAWLVAGRPQGTAPSLPYKGNNGGTGAIPPEYDRPGRARATRPDDDAAFLQSLRDRADAQRRAAEQERKARGEDG